MAEFTQTDVEPEPAYKINSKPLDADSRIHICLNGRYVTVFKHKGLLSCIDAICHHAGGPLTDGVLQDIEELGTTVVLCPWHRYMVSIADGKKIFMGIDCDAQGKTLAQRWKTGKIVQRPHDVWEDADGTYVRLASATTMLESCTSDAQAKSSLCGGNFVLNAFTPELVPAATSAASAVSATLSSL
jgi:nitrite reductase/ring-hydroxylating ferredoxin subunit